MMHFNYFFFDLCPYMVILHLLMKIGILGCKGRMGQVLMAGVTASPGATLVGGADKGDDAQDLIKKSDAVIDFTSPEVSLGFARLAAKHKKIHVIGTTGFTDTQLAELKKLAAKTPIFWSPNMSIGVNLACILTQEAAKLLDTSYDIEILEMHHRHKKDSPSGTALLLGEAAANGRKTKFSRNIKHDRSGQRKIGDIGYAVLRGGSVIGDHSVIFAGDHDRIEITHKSSSRDIYAKGAIQAALWLKGKKPKLYSMKDMLFS